MAGVRNIRQDGLYEKSTQQNMKTWSSSGFDTTISPATYAVSRSTEVTRLVSLSMNNIINKRTGWTALAAASVVGSSSALLAHAYVGWFGRFVSDDYCSAGFLRSYGFFGAQKQWFLRWSGRFSFVFAIDLAHVIGPKIVSFLPILVLSYWVAALTWTISQVITRSFGALRILVSALLAEIIIFGTLATSASVFQ